MQGEEVVNMYNIHFNFSLLVVPDTQYRPTVVQGVPAKVSPSVSSHTRRHFFWSTLYPISTFSCIIQQLHVTTNICPGKIGTGEIKIIHETAKLFILNF